MRSRPPAASSRAIRASSAELSALRNSALQCFSAANALSRGRASRPSPPPAVGFARIKSGTCDEKEGKVDTGPLCCRTPQKLSIELPEQFQRELHLARRCGRAGDRARRARQSARVGCRWWREHDQVRRIEIRAIQQVENFRAELHIQALANPGVFQYRKIPGSQARSGVRVPANVPV